MWKDINFYTNYVSYPGYSMKQQGNTVEYRLSKFPPCVNKVLQALLYKKCLFILSNMAHNILSILYQTFPGTCGNIKRYIQQQNPVLM